MAKWTAEEDIINGRDGELVAEIKSYWQYI